MMDIRLQQAPCGFVSTNNHGEITEVNDLFLTWTAYTKEQLLGQHIEVLLSRTNKLLFHSYFYPTIQLHQQVEEFFCAIQDVEKNAIPILINAKRYERDGIEVTDYMMMKMQQRYAYEKEVKCLQGQAEEAYRKKAEAFDHLEQIYAEIEQKQNELLVINSGLVEISNTDNLTGLYNRRYFNQKLSDCIRAFEMEEQPFSLWIIDIDYFKKVNDTFGHQAGDTILETLAHFLQEFIGKGGTVCRFGGEEFTILLDGVQDHLAQQLIEAVHSCKWPIIGSLTISIGVAQFTKKDSAQTIIEHADEALYDAKEKGRNRVVIYKKLLEQSTEFKA